MNKSYMLKTEEDYERSVDSLIKLIEKAYGDSSGETIIRRFLLNLYNSRNPAVGYNSLDNENFKMCLDVLLLDRYGGQEIHKYIQNGSEIFVQLWELENPKRKGDG